MRAVIQAVSSASVRVNGGEPRPIGPGLVILLGVKDTDTLDIVPKLAEKCAGLRIFKDENDKLNLSAKDLGYSALVVSQFTLYGDTKKGFRPSFIKAARPPLAVDAYELFLAEINKQGLKDVQHGESCSCVSCFCCSSPWQHTPCGKYSVLERIGGKVSAARQRSCCKHHLILQQLL